MVFWISQKKDLGCRWGIGYVDHLSKELQSYIDLEFLTKQGIFNIEKVTAIVSNHLSGKEDNTFKVWTFFCFQKWYKKQCSF